MHEELIKLLATATRIACTGIPSPRQAVLRASLDQARAVPAGFWERKAAAHAEFFNALADASADPSLAPVLIHGAGFACDLLTAVGRVADNIVINSRNRMLASLGAGDANQAALEMENHLRILHFMGRLAAAPSGQRASA